MTSTSRVWPVPSVPKEALAEFELQMQSRGVDLSEYDLLLEETEDSYIIATSSKRKPPRMRGSLPDHPDYEVVVAKESFDLIRVSRAR